MKARYELIGRKTRSSKKLWQILVALLIFTPIVVFGITKLTSNFPAKKQQQVLTPQAPAKTQPKDVVGKYLFNGTTVWARAVERDSQRVDGSYDYSHPFSQLSTFSRDKYDAWVTDFECPITNNTVPYATQVSNLVFNCRPEFLNEAAKYFDFFDLANNHTGDQGGKKGLDETRNHLSQIPNAQYFGSFDPAETNDICEVVALPVRIQIEKEDINTQQKVNLPVAMCAWHYFFRRPVDGEIEQMKKYSDIMPVFAFAEMGTEYMAGANAIQQEIAHKIIDQNPEFLVANNPHWVQNTEVYNNKLIVYSTGNFIFDQLEPEEQRSASLDVDLTVAYDKNIASWIALADECSKFQDDCLQKAMNQGLEKPKLNLKFSIVAGQGGAHKLTRRADAATQSAVEQRMNWAQTLQQLGQIKIND